MTVMVDENITSKYTFALLKVFCDYSVSFTSYNMGEVSQKYRVDIENERFSVACLRCHQNLKSGDFTSSLCRGLLTYLLKSVLQHGYLCSFNQ